MASKELERLINDLKEDKELAERFTKAKITAIVEAAKELGYSLDLSDFEKAGDMLSDDDLGLISGGIPFIVVVGKGSGKDGTSGIHGSQG